MRKYVFLVLIATLLLVGCGTKSKVKIYDDTEETTVSHDERTVAAVITSIDLEHNTVGIIECVSGAQNFLLYHGGVEITNAYGEAMDVTKVTPGMVMDVTYYVDTAKLVSMQTSSQVTVRSGVNKFSADPSLGKASYKGTTINMAGHAVAFDKGKTIDVDEVNVEDQVTLYIYGDKLVSVVIEVGHGFVRLIGQDTYIGGMVEIGYDVIVPVTGDMLLTVREGDYTLRINKDGFSNNKEVKVERDKEVTVNIADIAIPTGTVSFTVEPEDATLKINNQVVSGNIFTGLYGNYDIKLEAEGYQSFHGSIRIEEPSKKYTLKLVKLKDDTTEETTEETTEATTEASTEATTTEDTTTTEAQKEEIEGQTLTIKSPVGASVYVDGEYVGVAPVTIPKVAGYHTITLYQPGYIIKSYTVQVVDNGNNDEVSYPALTSLMDLIEE